MNLGLRRICQFSFTVESSGILLNVGVTTDDNTCLVVGFVLSVKIGRHVELKSTGLAGLGNIVRRYDGEFATW